MQVEETGGVTGPADEQLSALEAEVEQLKVALVNRDVIGMAKGILMSEHDCTPDEAFAHLRRLSQQENRKLTNIAAELVAARGGQVFPAYR